VETKFIDADEMDALTNVKRFFDWKSGTRKRIKNKYRRRCRRLAKTEIQQSLARSSKGA
tara:strand:+ start:600 stop:776 length:177 start_codon:yes stop_codon:yes gene_type:complete